MYIIIMSQISIYQDSNKSNVTIHYEGQKINIILHIYICIIYLQIDNIPQYLYEYMNLDMVVYKIYIILLTLVLVILKS